MNGEVRASQIRSLLSQRDKVEAEIAAVLREHLDEVGEAAWLAWCAKEFGWKRRAAYNHLNPEQLQRDRERAKRAETLHTGYVCEWDDCEERGRDFRQLYKDGPTLCREHFAEAKARDAAIEEPVLPISRGLVSDSPTVEPKRPINISGDPVPVNCSGEPEPVPDFVYPVAVLNAQRQFRKNFVKRIDPVALMAAPMDDRVRRDIRRDAKAIREWLDKVEPTTVQPEPDEQEQERKQEWSAGRDVPHDSEWRRLNILAFAGLLAFLERTCPEGRRAAGRLGEFWSIEKDGRVFLGGNSAPDRFGFWQVTGRYVRRHGVSEAFMNRLTEAAA